MGSIGLNVAAAIPPSADMGVARDLVWGLPWRGNVEFPGLAYCMGGKSLYWGGWCPRLTGTDLAAWPPIVAQHLSDHYLDIESETGVVRDPHSPSRARLGPMRGHPHLLAWCQF
jgi:hypothetical protein